MNETVAQDEMKTILQWARPVTVRSCSANSFNDLSANDIISSIQDSKEAPKPELRVAGER